MNELLNEDQRERRGRHVVDLICSSRGMASIRLVAALLVVFEQHAHRLRLREPPDDLGLDLARERADPVARVGGRGGRRRRDVRALLTLPRAAILFYPRGRLLVRTAVCVRRLRIFPSATVHLPQGYGGPARGRVIVGGSGANCFTRST